MRKHVQWTWRRVVGTLLGVLGIGMLTSCYGAPPGDSAPSEDDGAYSVEALEVSETVTLHES